MAERTQPSDKSELTNQYQKLTLPDEINDIVEILKLFELTVQVSEQLAKEEQLMKETEEKIPRPLTINYVDDMIVKQRGEKK